MRFNLLNSLCKLELAKYSLALSLQALLLAAIVRRLNYRMTSQSSLATYLQNRNAIRLRTRISCNNKETSSTSENETDYDSSTIICETKRLLSLKSLILILDPYKDERYFGKNFLKSLFFETYRTTKDFTGEETIPNAENISKQICIKPQEGFQSHLKKSLYPVNDLSENKCDGNKRWATWETTTLDISYQSNCQSSKPSEHSEVAIFAEKYFVKVGTAPMKTVASDNGFIRGNKYPTIREILMANKTSTFESISEQILSNAEHDSTWLKEELTFYPFHCAAIEQQDTITYNGYKTTKNVNLASAKAKPKQTSSNISDNFDLSKGEFESIKEPKLPVTERKSKSLETKKLRVEGKFSNLIWSIMRDDSNSDLRKLEDEVNYHATSFPNIRKFNTRHNSEYNETYSSDNSLMCTPRKKACLSDYQFTSEKEKPSEGSEGHHPLTKRARANSADSGICLDSNFEEILPDSPSQESSSCEDAGSETSVCHEFVSGFNNSKPLYVDDCYKVCQLCKKIILNKLFFTSRFGLLLNCFHSFCYSCIRNHSKSKRFTTDPVKCPKCGKTSPGIVSSPRWIRDSYEKTILFQKYEKESKFFSKQQQVFFNSF